MFLSKIRTDEIDSIFKGDKFLIKETVVLHWWESIAGNLVVNMEVIFVVINTT